MIVSFTRTAVVTLDIIVFVTFVVILQIYLQSTDKKRKSLSVILELELECTFLSTDSVDDKRGK